MALEQVLITVKTYPTLSSKYNELVCTAGFRADGSWIRIYPIPFRKIPYEEQYSKYDLVELDLVRNTTDIRPETFRPRNIEEHGRIIGRIDTKDHWKQRREIVLRKVYTDLDALIAEARNKKICTSLAVFKPKEVIDFVCEPCTRDWDQEKLLRLSQMNLFTKASGKLEIVNKLPYKFSYIFLDHNNKRSKLMIEDWETGALYWNCLRGAEGNEAIACAKVRQKYFDDFYRTKDLYFYLGTSLLYHFRSPNPFMIIGTFHPTIPQPPKVVPQLSFGW